jgi:nucleoside-diphosphate-sugar epimerase
VAPLRFDGECVASGATSAPSDGMTSAPSGGVTSALADGLTNALREATHVVTTIAPNEAGDPVLRCFRDTLLHRMPALQWIGYLSTTGVYGDHGGDWVDESSPCWPDTGRAIRRLAVEQEWQEVADRRDTPLAVLRLSGIYGPGRNAIVSVADGTARRIVRPGQWFNRIHVEDIAGATAMLARRATAGIFNISDDAPAPPQDVILHAAALLGVEPPPETTLDSPGVSRAMRTFYASNKRVSNARITSMGYAFRHPDYRAGLDAMWREDRWR